MGEVFYRIASHDHLWKEKEVDTRLQTMLEILLDQKKIAVDIAQGWVDLNQPHPELSEGSNRLAAHVCEGTISRSSALM